MATNAIALTYPARGVVSARWLFVSGVLASGDVGQVLDAPNFPDKSVTVIGPTGGTTAVVIEGTNEAQAATSSHPTGPYHTLHDPSDNALSFTAEGAEAIVENMRYTRPRIATATGGGSITVIITAQSGRR